MKVIEKEETGKRLSRMIKGSRDGGIAWESHRIVFWDKVTLTHLLPGELSFFLFHTANKNHRCLRSVTSTTQSI